MKTLFAKCLLLIAATLSLPSMLWAADDNLPTPNNSYLVSTLEEFNAAVKKVLPGDEIVLAKGNWTDMQLKFKTNGEEGKMIYLRGEEPGKVFIDGSSQLRLGGDYLYVYDLCFSGCVATSPKNKGYMVLFRNDSKTEANHSVISDCVFDSCVPEDKSFDDVWINLYGTHNTVQRCYMGGKDNKGLYIVIWHRNDKADYHTIKDNYFYRPISYKNGQNGQEIIRIGDSDNSLTDSSSIIENNFFYQCNGEVEILSIKSGDNIIRGNTFLECKGAVTLRHGNYNTVEGNYFLANGVKQAGGVRVINKGHKIYNNYFYKHVSNSTRAPISMQCGVENGALNTYNQVEDAEIYNNTLVDCTSNFSFCVMGKNTTLDPKNVIISGTLCVAPNIETSRIIDNNGRDDSGIKFVSSHLEGRDGVKEGEGFIEATYESEMMTIAGVTFPKLTAKTTISRPKIVESDISGESRKNKTPIGAISSAKAAPAAKVATNENCGPRWSGWSKPL